MYSQDTRKIIINMSQQGVTGYRISKITGITVSTVASIISLYKETGSTMPRPKRNGPHHSISDDKLQELKRLIDAEPSITADGIIEKLQLSCCRSTVHNAIKQRLGYTYKKSFLPDGQLAPAVKESRAEYKKAQRTIMADKIFFLDESSIDTGMSKEYGWGPGRVRGHAPDKRKEKGTMISAMGIDGPVAPLIFKGALNSEIFYNYSMECLIPALGRGSILVMDNCKAHKGKKARDAFLKAGIVVLYLPPYSPDLNPIEMMWSKIKGIVKSLRPRSYGSLVDAVGKAFDLVAKSDIKGWFLHDGYTRLNSV